MWTFQETDNGNCRVYYKNAENRLRCFQEDRKGIFTPYVCSRDGEPSHECAAPDAIDHCPPDDASTAVAFTRWWHTRYAIEESE